MHRTPQPDITAPVAPLFPAASKIPRFPTPRPPAHRVWQTSEDLAGIPHIPPRLLRILLKFPHFLSHTPTIFRAKPQFLSQLTFRVAPINPPFSPPIPTRASPLEPDNLYYGCRKRGFSNTNLITFRLAALSKTRFPLPISPFLPRMPAKMKCGPDTRQRQTRTPIREQFFYNSHLGRRPTPPRNCTIVINRCERQIHRPSRCIPLKLVQPVRIRPEVMLPRQTRLPLRPRRHEQRKRIIPRNQVRIHLLHFYPEPPPRRIRRQILRRRLLRDHRPAHPIKIVVPVRIPLPLPLPRDRRRRIRHDPRLVRLPALVKFRRTRRQKSQRQQRQNLQRQTGHLASSAGIEVTTISSITAVSQRRQQPSTNPWALVKRAHPQKTSRFPNNHPIPRLLPLPARFLFSKFQHRCPSAFGCVYRPIPTPRQTPRTSWSSTGKTKLSEDNPLPQEAPGSHFFRIPKESFGGRISFLT